MHKKLLVSTLLAIGLTVPLFLGFISVQAEEPVTILDILTNPDAYEGSTVEITGIIVAIEYGLIINDGTGEIPVSTGPLWYLKNVLNLEVGAPITVVGIVCTISGPNVEIGVHLTALTVNEVLIREDGGSPEWAGGRH